MNIADDLVRAFNDGYEKGKADAEAYMLHCGDADEPQTNADRIRGMTDKELAKWLDDISKACYWEGYTKETDKPQMSPYPTSPAKWVTWLKQEAKDETLR